MKTAKMLTILVMALVFWLGSAKVLAQPDQDKVLYEVGSGWVRYYIDSNGNGCHDPREPWPLEVSPKKSDMSCWMASASNLLVNEGLDNPYYGWLWAGGAPSPSLSPWGGTINACGGALMTFDDGGWQHWALNYAGATCQGPIITWPEFGGTWSTDPVAWCQERLDKGYLCGLTVYWGMPTPGELPGPVDPEIPPPDWGYHAITLVGIEPNSSTTGKVTITDSDDKLIGASRTCDYTYSGSNWMILKLYPWPSNVPVPPTDVNVNYAVAVADINRPSPVGTAFTYQGRLLDANEAADGLYDFQFKLYNADIAGTQRGSTIDVNEVDVIDGYFTVKLDFGSVFDGNERWLDIGVRPGELEDPNVYTLLSPRQEITPTPYAIYTAGGGGVGADSDWIISGNNMYSGVSGSVGIGTASPARKLDVAGSIRCNDIEAKGEWGGFLINSYWDNGFKYEDGYASLVQQTGDTGGLAFLVANSGTAGNPITWTWAMKIDKSGDVGIGTEAPGSKLDVRGNLTIENGGNPNLYVGTGGSELNRYLCLINSPSYQSASGLKAGGILVADDYSYAYPVANNLIVKGKVGIGTTSPAYKLDVEGDVQAYAYHTGDIFFQKNDKKLWRMFEDEDGLYLENLNTGRVYTFVLQEKGNKLDLNRDTGLEQVIKEFQVENESLKKRLEDLERTVQRILLAETKEVPQ